MNDSTAVARAILDTLIEAGVRDVVLAPGSRSAALALAFHAADASGHLRLHVRVDERTAGFLALGLSKGSHRPVPVVTTSGTAVANLHPAVLEARHAGVPLVVLSADRPAALRGTGANQTTEQHQLFGPLVPSVDVAAGDTAGATAAVRAAVRRIGPTQVNVQFSEPLLPDKHPGAHSTPPIDPPVAADWNTTDVTSMPPDPSRQREWSAISPGRRPRPDGAHWPGGTSSQGQVVLPQGPRTVLVAGDDAGPPARLLAEEANWPLLAEPTSGSRTGTHALRTYRLLLDTPLADRIERVVVAGHPTLSRPVTQLLSRADLEIVSIRGRAGVVTDPGRVARHLDVTPRVARPDDGSWLHSWRDADERLGKAVDALVASQPDALPLAAAAEVARAVPAGALLVVGSSQPVRDLDLMAPPYPAGERRLILGNRGLAGIDGTVSTAIGAALGRRSPRSLAYMGDVTFLHDAGGLVLGPDEPRPDLTIVVANDDGGAIFATLEQGAPEYSSAYERVFGTPHRVDLAALCVATGTPYERVDDAAALREALAPATRGIRVVEIPLPRVGRRRLGEDLRALAATID